MDFWKMYTDYYQKVYVYICCKKCNHRQYKNDDTELGRSSSGRNYRPELLTLGDKPEKEIPYISGIKIRNQKPRSL